MRPEYTNLPYTLSIASSVLKAWCQLIVFIFITCCVIFTIFSHLASKIFEKYHVRYRGGSKISQTGGHNARECNDRAWGGFIRGIAPVIRRTDLFEIKVI